MACLGLTAGSQPSGKGGKSPYELQSQGRGTGRDAVRDKGHLKDT